MFSRSGVEFPLVGGPQTLSGTPSWAWISRALLEKSLLALPSSCDGEPAPERGFPDILPTEVNPGGLPKGDLTDDPFGPSIGDVFPVEAPERGCSSSEAGRYPREGWSGLEDVILSLHPGGRWRNGRCTTQWKVSKLQRHESEF